MSMELEYNTAKEKLAMPEYGRIVLKMVQLMKVITDREKRSQQASVIVKVMETLNPHVRTQDDYRHKLWDHLYMIAGYDLDIDAPYPAPKPETFETHPVPLPMKGDKIKASHYGRNIEKIIDLICAQEDGEVKTELIKSLATYMRQQYLIWNKDSVADETIFSDLEKLSDYRIKVPQGLVLAPLSGNLSFQRPGPNPLQGQGKNRNRRNFKSRKR